MDDRRQKGARKKETKNRNFMAERVIHYKYLFCFVMFFMPFPHSQKRSQSEGRRSGRVEEDS